MMRPVTEKESLRFLKTLIKNADLLGINWQNHRKASNISDSTYRFTSEILSLDSLIKMIEHKKVKNVYWHPSVAPPGKGIDGIALRYRVYVEYNLVKKQTRRRKKPATSSS